MFRRCLTALLIVAYFAGQLAALPHAHAHARAPAGHGAQPHLHADWLPRFFAGESQSQHVHDHHASHPHSHHHHSPEHDGSHERPENAPSPSDDRGHDADCVYLSDAVIAQAPGSGHDPSQAAGDIPCLDAVLRDGPDLALSLSLQRHAPPDVLVGGCHLFLKLRTLRI